HARSRNLIAAKGQIGANRRKEMYQAIDNGNRNGIVGGYLKKWFCRFHCGELPKSVSAGMDDAADTELWRTFPALRYLYLGVSRTVRRGAVLCRSP
ncbi:MAG: hypothetical protein ACI9GW_003169, partial [Halieaceae bacterium]